MNVNIERANKDLTEMYNQLKPIVDSVVQKQSKEIDNIIERIKKSSELNNKEIQGLILQLSIETYYFSHIKDMSVLKQECATALMKEGQANSFNSTVGTQTVRQNQSIIDSLDKQAVNMLYNAVANNMKSKLDEAHRMINVLTNLLISKNAEAKLKRVQDDYEPNKNDLYRDANSEN